MISDIQALTGAEMFSIKRKRYILSVAYYIREWILGFLLSAAVCWCIYGALYVISLMFF